MYIWTRFGQLPRSPGTMKLLSIGSFCIGLAAVSFLSASMPLSSTAPHLITDSQLPPPRHCARHLLKAVDLHPLSHDLFLSPQAQGSCWILEDEEEWRSCWLEMSTSVRRWVMERDVEVGVCGLWSVAKPSGKKRKRARSLISRQVNYTIDRLMDGFVVVYLSGRGAFY